MKLYFDKQDRELLHLVNKVVGMRRAGRVVGGIFDAGLHPHGIKSLAMTREMRVAHAVAKLLDSLEAGQSEDRLRALRTLYDEVLGSAQTYLRRNTARVLIQVMKELVRAHGDEARQLRLARDFRRAAQGTPRVVRRLLADHHLVEMPEDWSQLAFDHHVHDANTKGRKTPTHLIMDAWIKGIRYLTVVYYNYANENAVREIMGAAEIMGMTVRVGIEFSVPFRGRYAHFIWVPRGFATPESFMGFFAEPATRHIMELGREASAWQQRYVFGVLDVWNREHRHELARRLAVDVPPVDEEAFRVFVGAGQSSLLHLAECIDNMLRPRLREKAAALRDAWAGTEDENVRRDIELLLADLENQSPAVIHDAWLTPEKNPGLPSPHVPTSDPDAPELLRLSPLALLDWLTSLHTGYRIILNLADLSAEDVLELLWICQGYITHLEIFNLKEWHEGRLSHLDEITELLRAVNRGSAPRLKRLILDMLKRREGGVQPDNAERCAQLRAILRNMPALQSFYSAAPLRTRMGTDSTSRSQKTMGMGLVFIETLNARGQKHFLAAQSCGVRIPFAIEVRRHVSYAPNPLTPQNGLFTRLARRLPFCDAYGYLKSKEWASRSSTPRMGASNIAALGGSIVPSQTVAAPLSRAKTSPLPESRYLNTRLSNTLKVLAGFIPALCAFQYTQSWWFLAWFGPLIWFAITGFRNIVQAVMAGGGLRRAGLLRWNEHVNWRRLCDSLMYTGFSVPILELGVRALFLQETLGYTVSNHPVLTYAAMSAANGVYLAWHNIYRGLPREAVIGNLFRSVLAIPAAVLYNELILEALSLAGARNPLEVVQPGAAIISKMASDTVAAAIEGFADRRNNIRMRRWDYETKLRRMFDAYARLELLFPEEDVLAMLGKPKKLFEMLGEKHLDMQAEIIVNALDFMHFWLYQPRAQDMFLSVFRDMSEEERLVFLRSQLALVQEREVSQLFVHGLVGKEFGRALAFYLDMHEEYLRAMMRLMPEHKHV